MLGARTPLGSPSSLARGQDDGACCLAPGGNDVEDVADDVEVGPALASELATYQGAVRVSVAANMASRARVVVPAAVGLKVHS